MGQYLKWNNMAQIKIHNGRYYAHAQTSKTYKFCLSWNSTKFIRTFMGQYVKSNKAGFPLGGLERADFVLRISIGWRFKNARQSRSEFDFWRREQ